jgi:PHS family inorganic phosphate transporter-like MFS transporter
MVLWGFRWFRLFLNPFTTDSFEHINVSNFGKLFLNKGADISFLGI